MRQVRHLQTQMAGDLSDTLRSSFLAGQVPLSFTLTPRQLRMLTALGTGILVGTSLIVIIPEGVDTLYSSVSASHANGLKSREWHALPGRHGAEGGEVLPFDPLDTTYPTGQDESFQHLDDPFPADSDGDENHGAYPIDESLDQNPETSPGDPHAYIGISLILGFILMYLIDKLPQTAAASLRPQRFHVSLNHLSFNRTSDSQDAGETPAADRNAHSVASPSSSSRPSSTTVGLVIHAAADGIALGASSTASGNLSFIIFVALMFHKAPAAFGLTSVLLKQGLSKRQARLHLIVFSLAAPAAALLTWLAIHLLGFSSSSLGDGAGSEFATGLLLLFSAGTFLYVAMHTMQESGDHAAGAAGLNGYAGVPMDDPYDAVHGLQPPPKPRGPTVVDVLVTAGGMLLPLLTQWGHAH